jgi:hypothetical protein
VSVNIDGDNVVSDACHLQRKPTITGAKVNCYTAAR